MASLPCSPCPLPALLRAFRSAGPSRGRRQPGAEPRNPLPSRDLVFSSGSTAPCTASAGWLPCLEKVLTSAPRDMQGDVGAARVVVLAREGPQGPAARGWL